MKIACFRIESYTKNFILTVNVRLKFVLYLPDFEIFYIIRAAIDAFVFYGGKFAKICHVGDNYDNEVGDHNDVGNWCEISCIVKVGVLVCLCDL